MLTGVEGGADILARRADAQIEATVAVEVGGARELLAGLLRADWRAGSRRSGGRRCPHE